METHPAVGNSASATTSSASHDTKKVESCAIVNEQEDERTCESHSLSTSTTTTTTATTSTTEQDQTNIMVPSLDNYGNNNASNDEQSVNSFINQQEQPQPSDSNSTGILSNNDHSIVNNNYNNHISKYQQQEEQQHRRQDEQVDSYIIDSQQDQNQDTRVIQEEREETQEQTKIIDQCEQNESRRGVDNDNNALTSHNVSQDEHVATEQSDRLSINEEENGSIPREKQSSRASTNDDQGEPSGTAALDESIAQTDTPSLDGNKDEEVPPRTADQSSLSSAQQSTNSEQHSEEGIDALQIVTEVQGQQEQSNVEHADNVSLQQQSSDHYRNSNDNDDGSEHIVKDGYEREERITDSVTENENEEHNEPDVDGSEEDIREELDQTERNVRIESSTSSPHSIEEQQHQLDIQPFPSLEGQSASSEALEGFGLTEGHSDDESSINTVEQHKQHQVNTHEVTLSENQGASSRTLGGPLPTESNPDGEAILLPTEQQQQVDIQSSRLLEDDGVRSADLEEPTPIPPYSSDELNREEQSQQLLSSSPANRTTSVNQQNITTYEYQQHSTTINHDRDDASDHTLHNAPRSRRVWEEDRQASECRRCNRRFNFLVRRHHCRRCGLVVCDRCSSHRIRLPPEEIVQDPAIDPSHYPLIAVHPQRVCDVCNRLPIKEVLASSSSPRRRATAPVSMSHMKRSPSSQSLMTECPVCGTDLLGMQKEDQEKHLQLCLNTGSPPVRPPRYLVYELSENSPQIDYECPICFEEFKAGEKIARMICLCSYHRHCLSDWLERGKGCPVHYDATISA